jgi:chromosome segregation ATPase
MTTPAAHAETIRALAETVRTAMALLDSMVESDEIRTPYSRAALADGRSALDALVALAEEQHAITSSVPMEAFEQICEERDALAERAAALEAERDGLQHQYDEAVNQWYAHRERAAKLEAALAAAESALEAAKETLREMSEKAADLVEHVIDLKTNVVFADAGEILAAIDTSIKDLGELAARSTGDMIARAALDR